MHRNIGTLLRDTFDFIVNHLGTVGMNKKMYSNQVNRYSELCAMVLLLYFIEHILVCWKIIFYYSHLAYAAMKIICVLLNCVIHCEEKTNTFLIVLNTVHNKTYYTRIISIFYLWSAYKLNIIMISKYILLIHLYT